MISAKANVVLGGTLMAVGLVVVVATVVFALTDPSEGGLTLPALTGGGLLVLGYAFQNGSIMSGFKVNATGIEMRFAETHLRQHRVLTADERSEKQAFAQTLAPAVPGQDAPAFRLTDDLLGLINTPKGSPLVPMYVLDANYRVLDWNEAFSLAFDNTLEGRRGLGILEWTYFLDNYEEVLKHGIEVFSPDAELPSVDVEEIRYHSQRYGMIVGEKRAFRIPDSDGGVANWLVTIMPEFDDAHNSDQYYLDLSRHLQYSLMWTEYALSYDDVLSNTRVYPELLRTVVGPVDGSGPVHQGARILDLGCGTGNLELELLTAAPGCEITALDSNEFMLSTLRRKCSGRLRTPDNLAGPVTAIKQDLTNLNGLDDSSYDYAFANNVFYSLPTETIPGMLKEIKRKLKPGAELRATGPRTNVRLDKLFKRIRKDLESSGRFDQLQVKYEHVRQINEDLLAPLLTRLGENDYRALLKEAGFDVLSCEFVYERQGWFVTARRPYEDQQTIPAQPA